MNTYRTAILSAVLSLAAAAPSYAATTARGTVSNIGFELIDLDLNDGITPSLNFNVTGGYYFEDPYTELKLADQRSGYNDTQRQNETMSEPYQRSASYAPSASTALNASASVTGRLFGGLVMQAQASSAGGEAEATSLATSGHVHFILSPNTAVRITADLYATATRAPGLIDGGSYADVHFLIFQDVPESSGYSRPDEHLAATYMPDESTTSLFQATHVDYVLNNRSSASITNMLTFNAMASAHTLATSPVPEPATYGMLLAGLGVLAATARRRRR
ncbi:PEP-CTERM sorting domain-containing protein [Massilia scottii]|uniref:PEP-CTERM sorting domain-containing protein n=1 Tax=Massilia scottii TaxID=3057166 RepID=UPI00279656F6|nr:PEP-CTERM sorting domain-containing protein [Massilia sp. CCM 9029]MDQ1834490.1 PEP-CTERM sorting domain-containing protein [Massilia sp. CCM 9029]